MRGNSQPREGDEGRRDGAPRKVTRNILKNTGVVDGDFDESIKEEVLLCFEGVFGTQVVGGCPVVLELSREEVFFSGEQEKRKKTRIVTDIIKPC